MEKARMTAAVLAASFVGSGVVRADGLKVTEELVTCALANRHPQIAATLSPAEDVLRARLRFRTTGKKEWFGVTMSPEGDRFVATLPRPKGGLKSFEYVIEATDAASAEVRSPEHTVTVVGDSAKCPGGRVAATGQPASKLVVESPTTGSDHPPIVPPGWSADNVVGDMGQFELSAPVAVGAAAVVTAGALVAAGKASNTIPTPVTSTRTTLELVSANPPSGSTVSLANGNGLMLVFRVFAPEAMPAGLVNVYISQGARNCARVSGTYAAFNAGETREVVAGNLSSTGLCNAPFQTFSLPAYLEEGERIRATVTSVLQYTFVP
jgi:hypothetical protein